MMLLSLFSWWYTTGWKTSLSSHREILRSTADNFSISLLLRTLFSPFRQISAGKSSSENLSLRFHALLDRTISRVIGAIVRLLIIFAGLIIMLFELILSALLALLWPLIPFLPLAGLALTITGFYL